MKPILLGMNNPYGSNPQHALYPAPQGCTGWRIWRLLNLRVAATRGDYLRAFDRRNLLGKQRWSVREAREAARDLLPELEGREVVVLGAEVRDIFRLTPRLVHPQEKDGVVWRQLPHPSGRCLWYNNADNQMIAATLLEELYGRDQG